ncbi:PilZ domain-containing protein [Algibacillus agarilyticus]|uniref:PilZ domain-containing protein n=1 Tax=Algibacillus agarilyticus TaxID=2234133 RepID=UPI000DD00095|nr:PilZ domain-containing protein [Algibacillus agarilyticus]
MQEIPVEFRTVQELYKSYMSFFNNGGLFVQTTRPYDMGDAVALSVLLPNALDSLIVSGQVAWLNPLGASSATPQGIGIAFIDDKDRVKDRIETMLGTLLNSSEPTYTM